MILKGFIFPRMLFLRFARDRLPARFVRRFSATSLRCCWAPIGTALALAFSSKLPLLPEHYAEVGHTGHLLVPASLSTVLIGYLILATRHRAITQTLGYLVLENGIFIFGLLLIEAMPLLVELGVLLDLFVAVFVMGITIQHLARGFASDSTEHLSALKE